MWSTWTSAVVKELTPRSHKLQRHMGMIKGKSSSALTTPLLSRATPENLSLKDSEIEVLTHATRPLCPTTKV